MLLLEAVNLCIFIMHTNKIQVHTMTSCARIIQVIWALGLVSSNPIREPLPSSYLCSCYITQLLDYANINMREVWFEFKFSVFALTFNWCAIQRRIL